MKFGHFDDSVREYVVDSPITPFPWINYLGTSEFFSIISNTAGGYAFYRDASLRRLTRFRYNNVPSDAGGRYFYLSEEGVVWNPGFMPTKTPLDHYECRHGLGYTRITGERDGVRAEALFFVPVGKNVELQRLSIENRSGRARHIELFSFIEFALWNAFDDATNYQRNLSTGEVEIDGSAIYHKTEYRERRNHYAFYAAGCPIKGFDTDRDSFLGPAGGFGDPAAVLEGRSRNSVADGWSPIGAHHIAVDLAPGETREIVFLLGYVENHPDHKWTAPGVINKEEAHRLQAELFAPGAADAELVKLGGYWEELLSHFRISSGENRLDRLVNVWNQYQCMVTYNVGRSASYFESGVSRGLGFRDTSQDLLGFVHLIPARARERILDVAATQFPDGGCYHQYQPLTKRGNYAVGGNFNDDPLWLIAAAAAYLKETGDWAILDEGVPFDNDPSSSASLFEHLGRSFDHVVDNLGPHGLPLIGRADWNDCLNLNCYSTEPDQSFQTTVNQDGRVAESLLIAGMFVFYGRDYAEIARRHGAPDRADKALGAIEAMERSVVEHGWDGEWYLRAYDGHGEKVGSRECREGQIYIEPQGFCSMAGIGSSLRLPEQALDAVKERLDTPHGIVLLQPPYTRYELALGEISSYPPGYKENAGIFCHNNPWIMIAEALLGRADRAWDYYRKIAPTYLEEQSDLHRTEPYVYAQMIAGRDARRFGEAKNSWLTGTAAWNFVAISQYILGIRPVYDGLEIDPCIPAAWRELSVERLFRGTRYHITITNPDGRTKGVREILIDGKKHPGGPLLYPAGAGTVHVDVLL